MAWRFARAQSSVEFAVQHLMVATVHGRFEEFDVDIDLDPDAPTGAVVRAVIQAASIATGSEERDARLRSTAFLDVERYPTITFSSSQVAPLGAQGLWVRGNLTIRDTTKEIVLDGNVRGPVEPPGEPAVDIVLVIAIDRADFLDNVPDVEDLFVGRTVLITINAHLENIDDGQPRS